MKSTVKYTLLFVIALFSGALGQFLVMHGLNASPTTVVQQTFEVTITSLTEDAQEIVTPHLKMSDNAAYDTPSVEYHDGVVKLSGRVVETLKTGAHSTSSYTVVFTHTLGEWVPIYADVNGTSFLSNVNPVIQ